jgi:hypothetical protein
MEGGRPRASTRICLFALYSIGSYSSIAGNSDRHADEGLARSQIFSELNNFAILNVNSVMSAESRPYSELTSIVAPK